MQKTKEQFRAPKWLRYSIAGFMSAALVLRADIKPAEAVFERFTTYLQESVTTFTGAVGAGAIAPLATAALGLIPWLVIVVAGSVIIWQVYAGYQEYQRENYAGIAKPVTNILFILFLMYITDAITGLLVAGGAG